MLHLLQHVVPEAFVDVLKTVPLLLVVYALLYYIENRLTNTPTLLSRAAQFGADQNVVVGSNQRRVAADSFVLAQILAACIKYRNIHSIIVFELQPAVFHRWFKRKT